MNFQNETLPQGAVKVGSTPSMTEETVVAGILKKHLAPRGKYGYLVVEEGTLQFIWEDDHEVLDAAPQHPIVIFPERFHHVEITGRVKFRVEFYSVDQNLIGVSVDQNHHRNFVDHRVFFDLSHKTHSPFFFNDHIMEDHGELDIGGDRLRIVLAYH